jgi:hypothetical protein
MSANTIKYYINNFTRGINDSRLLSGLCMIFLNIGSKYIELGLTKTQEQALRNVLAREMLIFAMVFMTTRDLITSILMTGAFSAMTNHLFNEKSKYCILPDKLRRIAYEIDLNKDGSISPEEEEHALQILRKAKEQKERSQQANFTSYIATNSYFNT